jgi:curli biogenesis system outer membrane secretion channel CsgG
MRRILWAIAAALLLVPSQSFAQVKGKPVVAVSQIDDIAHTGQSAAFQQMIETAVAETGKFRVIERRVGGLLAEQQGAKAGLYTSNTPGKIGGFEGADFLIEASITTGQSSQRSNLGASIGHSMLGNMLTGGHTFQNCQNAVATIGIDVKITDASSGQIRYATRIEEQQQSQANCGSQASVDLTALLRSAADKTAAGLLTTMYPIMIAAVQSDGTMVLNYGESAVQPQAIMAVHSKGADIRDPVTGDVIGSDEQTLGLIRISDVQPRMSRAVPVTPFAVQPQVGSIVRPATDDEIARFSPGNGKHGKHG